ncbi:MAG: DsbA family protein, partial [Acidobacteriia bacterium]|nr:DsbA family protein [Terriglobia bacterium]
MKNYFRNWAVVIGVLVITGLTLLTSTSLGAQQAQPKRPVKPSTAAGTKGATAKPAPKLATSAPASGQGTELVNQRIADHLRSTFNVSPEIELTVVGRNSSKLMGLDTVTVEVNDGVNAPHRLEVLITPDNKFALMPQIFDLSVDPFTQKMREINLGNSPVKGSRNAGVTIVEYSDFECPKCSQAYHTLEDQVFKQYGDKVKLVYKNYPLPTHPWAQSAAIAGMCAFQQSNDAFWSLYRAFFEEQSSIKPENVKATAVGALTKTKIDLTEFEKCYDNKSSLSRVQADIEEAGALNIQGTPLFIVNGRPVPGAVS